MPATRRLRVSAPHDHDFERDMQSIRDELKLSPHFSPAAETEAAEAARHPRLPTLDCTDIPFVTLDPVGSMDLDQALHVTRQGTGLRLHYAIADVGAFVTPGGAIDREARVRGETLYGADRRLPLHPPVLSEGAASLLPDQVRPALLWTIDVDAAGGTTGIDVRRALVRSRARCDYDGVQAQLDAGRADPMWDRVRELGELRMARQNRRGAISLGLPEQEIAVRDGHWVLEYRARHPVENWNEQLSLLTGMAAAQLMVQARTGLLRTLPEPDRHAVVRLRHTAHALGIDWPAEQSTAAFIHALDASRPLHLAMMVASISTLRGADYVAFQGSVPEQHRHAALAAEYSHATAPLRRLVDRFTGEVCLAVCAGTPVPEWTLEALPSLPDIMRETSHRASRFEHAVLDLVEAVVLEARIGESFSGCIIEIDRGHDNRGDAMVREPAIEARVDADTTLPLGEQVRLQLTQADPATRQVRFQWQRITAMG